jgi:phage baseplate assembly protein W
MNLAFPFGLDALGRCTGATDDDHLRQMIEQLLFTSPGERVNRPDFGSGLMQLVFAPNSDALASTIEFTLHASLQQYLGDLIEVQALHVTNVDATLGISVRYVVRATGAAATAAFQRSA